MLHIDPGDVVFIAAALAAGADIWSDDPHFTKQKKIKGLKQMYWTKKGIK